MFWFCAFSCCSWHFNMHLILTVIQVEYELSQGVMFQMLGVQLMALFQCGNLRRRDQARGSRPPGVSHWGCIIPIHFRPCSLLWSALRRRALLQYSLPLPWWYHVCPRVTGTKSPWARLLNPWAEMNLSFLRFHLWCALFQRNKVTSTTSYTKNHYFASLRVDPDHHIESSPLHVIITTKKALSIVQHLLSMDYSHSNELDNNCICKIPPTVGVVCFFMMYGINFSSLCFWDQVFLYWVIFLFSKSTIIPPSHEKAKQSSSQPSWLLVENPQAWHLVCSTIHTASFSI